MHIMMTSAQSRAARGLLGWTQADLAGAAKVGVVTVRQFEGGNAEPRSSTLTVMRQALEAAGVIFIPEDRHGPGVRLEHTAAFEEALASLVRTLENDADLSRIEVIVAGFSDEDRGVLATAFRNRVWGGSRREADPRGCEIQDRLTRTGGFQA